MTTDQKNKFAMRDLEYPKLELLIVKRGIVSVKGEDAREGS
jgi:hypothetical protein